MTIEADRAGELADVMREDAAEERGRMEGLAWTVYQGRLAGRQANDAAEPLRQWLELHEGEVVTDAEHGVYAELTRTSRTVWDLRPLNADAVLALHFLGLLDVKSSAFDALRKAAPDVMLDAIQNTPGVRTSSESSALQVRSL